ncbi:MAG TPA: DUF5694 domain-containing protein [Rhodanobacteraceae bacterium]|nr:DUF5694 domain-containing protein [Rhodanobacteraceae bacterium]
MIAAIACSTAAHAQVDLTKLDHGITGPRTQILVLGTAHLSNAPKGFDVQSLQPLLARLAAFKPDIITIEGISGEGCALMAQYPTIYNPEGISPYCFDTKAAKAATGLDVPAAVIAVDKAMQDWPAQPTAAQRRHLASLFLACGEPASALVQWLQLPRSERHTGDGLDDALVKILNDRIVRKNEDYQIAAPLAVRLGERRVYPIDDHTGDNVRIPDSREKAFEAAIRAAWASGKPQMQPIEDRQNSLLTHNDTLALYRFLNQPVTQQTTIESDMGGALRDGKPPYYGHMYVAGWEARNLRMAANIVATFRERPGARVLVIVGATHKPWLDKILGQLPGIQIVDAEKILGAAPK